MLKKLLEIAAVAFLFGALTPAWAEQPHDESPSMTAEQFLATLKFQSGQIDLSGGIAVLDLPPTFRYLNPEDSERLLVDAWGNPPGDKTLGMIFPADVSPMSSDGWGVIITYDKDGHVSDGDADQINYDDLLKDMQAGMEEANVERKKQGYDSLSLVGWAETPSYDKANHKLYWAKELASGASQDHPLNYNIRILGREGVLVLNAVAGMSQIATIKTEMQKVMAFTDFKAGNNYADFNSNTDKVAGYGIAALVAGGVAAKLGFFAKLFAMLLVFKKALILGVIAAGVGIKKLLGMKKKQAAAETAE